MKKILTFIITIFLSLSFQVHSIEIEIITDKPGTGKKIIRHSWVQLEYTGSFENGKIFDTNIGKDRPLVVQMSMKEVIPGFEQGIIGTTKGTKRKIKIPAELAYGKKGGGDIIPPNTDLIFEFEVIDVLDPSYKSVSSDELIEMIENNAVALDIRTEEEWDKTGVIKGSFPETAFDKNGKFQVYVMDKIRALAASQSQDVNLIFISHDGETASMLANSFSEDLGFTNVSVLKGGILQWLKEDRKLFSHKKDY
jgi:peptidylprolyl isomerase